MLEWNARTSRSKTDCYPTDSGKSVGVKHNHLTKTTSRDTKCKVLIQMHPIRLTSRLTRWQTTTTPIQSRIEQRAFTDGTGPVGNVCVEMDKESNPLAKIRLNILLWTENVDQVSDETLQLQL